MKTKDKQAYHNQTIDQLQAALLTAVQELAHLQLDLKAGQTKDLHSAAKKRHQIAFIKTLITQKQLETKN
jgi:ribosomal protein L29